jgi:WbqC-like protein family
MLVTIHQPEHLPWLGFLDKARRADLLVLLDTVQYRKNYFQNRNRIRTANGPAWVTVPVLTKGNSDQAIRDVRVNGGSPRWREKYWGTVEQSYRSAPFWTQYCDVLRGAIWTDTTSLAELNERIIHVLFDFFRIEVRTVRASELSVSGARSELLLSICQSVGADRYLSGISGREYLDVARFEAAGVSVEFHEFHHPLYQQRYQPFMPCMSSIDLLFNHGPESAKILQGIGVAVMDEVFT